MASPLLSSKESTSLPAVECRRFGAFQRATGFVLSFAVALQPLHLIAATGFYPEPPLPELLLWDPLPTTRPNPFVWPPPSQPPLLYQLPRKTAQQRPFPSFRNIAGNEALPPPSDQADPWTPADLAPIPLPNGMPVQGNPAGLAMLENAVGNGTIYGEVSDATTLNPIAGALVEIAGTGRTAETDAQGRYRFDGIPAGTFNIEASQLGYFGNTTVITVIEGSPSEVRFGLRVKPTDDSANEFTLEEETIVGEYQEESGGDFSLDLAIDSPNISAGLGKEDFSRTGASDAGAAVSKISGANIVGGRYAVVRGLGDRYSNTLFNGALIPSADPSRKAVQLDLFPSDLLESVAITKLFLPELPAEFAGGTVQIQTLRLPQEPIIEVSIGTKWFSERPDGEFLGDPTTEAGFSEIKYPLLPNGFDAPNGFTGSVADSILLHQSAPMRPSSVDDEQAASLSVVLGNTFELHEGIRLGAVFALTRDTENSYEDQDIGRGYRFNDPGTPLVVDPFLDNTRRSEVFSRELTFGVMGSLSLELGDRHEFGYTKFFNESFSDDYVRTTNSRSRSQEPVFIANPFGVRDAAGDIVRVFAQPLGATDFFEPLQRSLDITQFTGKHVIYGEKTRGGTISWGVSNATAIEERPQSRTYGYTTLDFGDAESILPAIFDASQFRPDFPDYDSAGDLVLASGFPSVNIFRESLITTDVGENQRADVSLPYYFDDESDDHVGIRFGYNRSERDRMVRGRFFTYDFNRINDELLPEDSLGNYQGDSGNQFHDGFNSAFFPGDPTRPIFGGDGITINDFSGNGSTIRNIDAATFIESHYVGADFATGPWTVSGGFRMESEDRSFQIIPGLNPGLIANPAPVVVSEDVLLPGIVLTRTLGAEDEILLTFGWSETVARPTFYEFAPAFVVDQATGDVTRGNPDLRNSSITNIDLRFDWKTGESSNVGIGLFRKTIKDPIVDAFDPVLNAQSWINGDSGTLSGLEFEANTLLAERFRLGGNYTFIDSDLKYSLGGQQLNTGFTGQPTHIFNIFAGYEDAEEGVSANFVYNFTGSYLSAAPTAANAPGIIEESFQSLDLILSKTFDLWDCDGKVTLGIRNILDSERRQFFDGTDLTFRRSNPGRSLSLSCEMNF